MIPIRDNASTISEDTLAIGEDTSTVREGASMTMDDIAMVGADTPDQKWICGNGQIDFQPWEPFAPPVLDFLAALSTAIREEQGNLQGDPEIAAFGFFIRRKHLEQMKKDFACGEEKSRGIRLGRGMIVHIAPSNVPMVFAYSLTFGLLAGCSNVVKLSERAAAGADKLAGLMVSVLAREEYSSLRGRISVIRCQRENPLLTDLLGRCDVWVVWGGDETVRSIRGKEAPAYAVDVFFPDRYSAAVLSADRLKTAGEEEIRLLAHRFYRDTYEMDQNACSSPQMVFFLNTSGEDCTEAVDRFWTALGEEAFRDYQLDAYKVSERYQRMALAFLSGALQTEKISCYGANRVAEIRLLEAPAHLHDLKGGYGLFYSAVVRDLKILCSHADAGMQTVCVWGVDAEQIADEVVRTGARGISRIVPVGEALTMQPVWDGRDLLRDFTRVIDVQ
ncbi:MAG: acyl-CoA reductase [Bilifractor sp.]